MYVKCKLAASRGNKNEELTVGIAHCIDSLEKSWNVQCKNLWHDGDSNTKLKYTYNYYTVNATTCCSWMCQLPSKVYTRCIWMMHPTKCYTTRCERDGKIRNPSRSQALQSMRFPHFHEAQKCTMQQLQKPHDAENITTTYTYTCQTLTANSQRLLSCCTNLYMEAVVQLQRNYRWELNG